MTTIATDGHYVAADTGVTFDGMRLPWGFEKIRSIGGRVYAFSGCTPQFDPFVRWWEGGRLWAPPPPVKDSPSYFWVFENGHLYELNAEVPHPLRLGAPSAIGHGAPYAITAMLLGKTAGEAVEVAIMLDAYTFGDVQVVELPERLRFKPQLTIPSWPNLPKRPNVQEVK